MSDKLMKCGHTAQGRTKDHKPVCVICIGLTPDAEIEVPEGERPDLTGRTAECTQCKNRPSNTSPSKFSLPFFEHRPNYDTDRYYCGCWGWD